MSAAQEEYLQGVIRFYNHEFRLISSHIEGLLDLLERDTREHYTFRRALVDRLDDPHRGQQAKEQLMIIYQKGEPQRIEERTRYMKMLQAELHIFNEIMQQHVDKLHAYNSIEKEND